MQADVSHGSDSAVTAIFGDGSYTPDTGHGSARLARQKSAKSRPYGPKEKARPRGRAFSFLIPSPYCAMRRLERAVPIELKTVRSWLAVLISVNLLASVAQFFK